MKPSNNIGYLLNHIAFILARRSDHLLQEKFDIGYSQFKIMMVLKSNPSIQQKQIAGMLGQTEASISRQIKWLVKDGLLNTTINVQNKREHITSLTPTGEKLIDNAMQQLNEYHSPAFEHLSSIEQKQLISMLNTMHEAVCIDKKTNWHHS